MIVFGTEKVNYVGKLSKSFGSENVPTHYKFNEVKRI